MACGWFWLPESVNNDLIDQFYRLHFFSGYENDMVCMEFDTIIKKLLSLISRFVLVKETWILPLKTDAAHFLANDAERWNPTGSYFYSLLLVFRCAHRLFNTNLLHLQFDPDTFKSIIYGCNTLLLSTIKKVDIAKITHTDSDSNVNSSRFSYRPKQKSLKFRMKLYKQ